MEQCNSRYLDKRIKLCPELRDKILAVSMTCDRRTAILSQPGGTNVKYVADYFTIIFLQVPFE